MRRPKVLRHAAALGLALLIAPGFVAPARAQRTPDPYNIVGDGNARFQDDIYANYPNGAGFSPNQGILQGRSGLSRSNQFQDYVNNLDGAGNDSGSLFGPSTRGRGGITPYYRAHREFDQAFNRVYSPNEGADKTYYQDQRARTDKYLEYLREPDPKKRAQLFREYNQQSLQSARDSGSGSSRAALRGGTSERASASASSSSPTAPRPSSTNGGNLLRRPSSPPAASNRTRSLLPSSPALAPGSSSSERPSQILDRSGLMDRANRTTAPARVPGRTAPR